MMQDRCGREFVCVRLNPVFAVQSDAAIERRPLQSDRLCENSAHGSRASPRAGKDSLEINALTVRPELSSKGSE